MSSQYELDEMIRRVVAGNAVGVRAMLAQGFDVNTVDGDYRCQTALHRAASDGSDEICRILIEAGAGIEALDDQDQTSLHYAVEYDHPKIVALLLGAGAQRNPLSTRGETPLHVADMVGNSEIWAQLAEAGADVHFVPEQPKENYLTPFQNAVYDGKERFVRYFLERGDVDLGQRTLAGESLFKLANNHGSVKSLLMAERTRQIVSAAFDSTDPPLIPIEREDDLPARAASRPKDNSPDWGLDIPF